MATELKVTVPDIGDYQDVPVIELLVAVGDTVDKDQAIATLESDKATLDVPAPEAGVVKSIAIKVGDKVSMGDAVMVIEVGAADAPAEKAPAEEAPAGEAEASEKADSPSPQPSPEGRGSSSLPLPPGEVDATASGEGAPPADETLPAEEAPPAAETAAEPIAVTIPDIGDYSDVPVIEVLVADGDTVEKDQTLVVLESDKATLDVPAPAAGVVSGLAIKVGDKVAMGTAVCVLSGAASRASAPEKTKSPSPQPSPGGRGSKSLPLQPGAVDATASGEGARPASAAAPETATASDTIPYASPSIRKFARELGVDLAKVGGSGPKGRITQDDVQGYVKLALAKPPAAASAAAATSGSGIPPIPAVDFAQFGEIEVKPLARIRKLSAAHLHRAWLNIPHVTQTDEADITELEAFRKEASEESAKAGGPKLTLLPFVMKAMAKVLEAYPEFRASLSPDGESLIHKRYTHIGFAADTPNGLMVPVVRDVDRKSITQLAVETGELAAKARDGKLKGGDMKGGVFSISSLGGIGGSHFTPIVNAPEVGILGVSKAVIKPVWDGAAFQPRLMVPLSLSYDHRVIDGAYAARTMVLLVKLLGDMRRLVL
ncbi:dihydrolipoyllysine-residue acetyltransferase [Nevskia sp.]|uniref:dihydrolipoyllysine-residue acetyltransferase n=1 Tax=Nevskia sp. TaxID=1929292 RepID=UPI0025E54147|nr:dihydrolipoyllysine-residue acetyltransferase [Nevskia sp.]